MITFQEMYKRHYKFIFNLALRYAKKNYEEARDLTQETFFRAFKYFDYFDQRDEGRNWLAQILKNNKINIFRREKSFNNSFGEKIELDKLRYTDKWLISKDQNPQEQIFDQFLRNRILDSIAELDPKFGNVATLALLEKRRYDEIAEIEQIGIGTVKSRLHRAKNMLKDKLKEWY